MEQTVHPRVVGLAGDLRQRASVVDYTSPLALLIPTCESARGLAQSKSQRLPGATNSFGMHRGTKKAVNTCCNGKTDC
jgi:hypothetical protein